MIAPRRQPGDRRDRGAVVVEMALVAPFLVLIALAVLEFGLGWRSSLTVSNSVRAGARAGSSSANNRSADYDVLQAVRAAMASWPSSQIERVVVYKAPADGEVPAACRAGGSQTGLCNVYSPSDLSRPASDFSGACSATPDMAWCPTTREARQAAPGGPDRIGVYIRYRHGYVSRVFPGGGITIEDQTVMRLEPQ